jgi:hypothetical protein
VAATRFSVASYAVRSRWPGEHAADLSWFGVLGLVLLQLAKQVLPPST